MIKRIVWLVTLLLLAAGTFAEAQKTGKVFRIGFLDASTVSGSAVLVEPFRQELSKLGWIERKNIAFEYRFAEGQLDRQRELAAELVRLKVDLIVVAGLVASLAQPGRQCHRAFHFSARARHQKDRGAQGRGS